jgi:hypothetical protein
MSMAMGEPHRILLDLHASAAAVALLAPHEIDVDVGGEKGETGRHPLENRDECRPVGFTGGREAKHGGSSRRRRW